MRGRHLHFVVVPPRPAIFSAQVDHRLDAVGSHHIGQLLPVQLGGAVKHPGFDDVNIPNQLQADGPPAGKTNADEKRICRICHGAANRVRLQKPVRCRKESETGPPDI